MKPYLLTLLFVATISFTYSQNTIDELVKEGVEYHDNESYDKAIESYKKALEIDPKSSLANYELSLTYSAKTDYKNAIKYADIVLKQNSEHMLHAYLVKGSALDLLGRTNESITLFKKAIKKHGNHYLLCYNLALNYFKQNNLDDAEAYIIKGIENNPNHSSSHLILASIENQKGNTVQALLSSHYFLFLEPMSGRSSLAFEILSKNFGGNVTKDKDNPNNINILLSANNNSQFGAAELMVSMLEASKSLEENKGKSDDEMFIENTGSFFKILGELKEENNKQIWWTLYTDFYYDVALSPHLTTYCKYITQIGNENSKKWVSEHKTQLNEFDNWLANH